MMGTSKKYIYMKKKLSVCRTCTRTTQTVLGSCGFLKKSRRSFWKCFLTLPVYLDTLNLDSNLLSAIEKDKMRQSTRPSFKEPIQDIFDLQGTFSKPLDAPKTSDFIIIFLLCFFKGLLCDTLLPGVVTTEILLTLISSPGLAAMVLV